MLARLKGDFVLTKFVQFSAAACVLILNSCTQLASQYVPIVIL